MRIEINGIDHEVTSTDLATLLGELQKPQTGIATALNGTFVPAAARALTPVGDGDKLEILSPMQGG